jgi:hypothetical protein
MNHSEEGFAMSLPASKPTRNADYRHAQSLGRQCQNVTASPRQQAEAIAAIVRKRLSDGQPLPNLNEYNLSDNVWNELCGILTSDELAEVNVACAGAIADLYDPVPEQVPDVAASHTASWRDQFPAHTHSMTWVDESGMSHSHTVRADSLDDLVRQVGAIKALIASAKHKAEIKRTQGPTADHKPQLSSRRCEMHASNMVKVISRKTGWPYAYHGLSQW